jgi:predicted metal-dependent peptidase
MSELHPKLSHSIELMLLNPRVNLPYYGEFLLHVNFIRRDNDKSLKTAGVNVTPKGMNYFYNTDFIDDLTQEQVNFLNIHELFHLLLCHPKRTRMGGYDHELSNIAQDMIINQIIVQDINSNFVDIPRDYFGRNSALFIPKEYEGEWVFEILYDYIKGRQEEFLKRKPKKDDNKIFSTLYAKEDRPSTTEVYNSYVGQHAVFSDILIEKSKTEYEKYVKNFVRKALVSLQQGIPFKVIGHTDSYIPEGADENYNQLLSERRAELFKNAIIENIDKYIDKYIYCMEIINYEINKSEQEKLNFIFKYEEIENKTVQKQREVQLKKVEDGQVGNKIDMLYREYRFTELDKIDTAALINIIKVRGLNMPDTSSKNTIIGLATNLIEVVGKGSSELIIENDLDDAPAILRADIANNLDYITYKKINKSENKRGINRRIEYQFDKSQDENMGGGSGKDSENTGNKGNYGKNGKNDTECHSLDDVLDNIEENGGEYLDSHLGDEVPDELREQMVKDIHDKLKARGLVSADIQSMLDKLQKKKKDYLREIKRGISLIKGHVKTKSITRPNRKGVSGLKGNKKLGAKINCILDTSGSMSGYYSKALSFIFRNDIEINLIFCDAKVHSVENIKSMSELQKVVPKGGGGTTIQPAFDYITEKFNDYNTLLLTDGYTDSLNLSKIKGKVLIISNSVTCPINNTNGKVKQIIVKDE